MFKKKQAYCSKLVAHLSRRLKDEIDSSNVLEDEKLEEALTKKGKIRILPRLDHSTKRVNVVNLLMITRAKKKHYTAIKNLSRLLSRGNASSLRVYNYYINCLNGFCTVSVRDKN